MNILISPNSARGRLKIRQRTPHLRAGASRRRRTVRSGLSTERRLAFLQALARASSLDEALALAGVDRPAVMELRARDALFARDWDRAQDQRVAQIETLLLDKAIGGLAQDYPGDKSAESAMRYSTNLGMWLLEARMPHRYSKGTARPATEPRKTTKQTEVSPRDPVADAQRINQLIAEAERRLIEAEAACAAAAGNIE